MLELLLPVQIAAPALSCAPYAYVRKHLAEAHQRPIMTWLADRERAALQVFASPDFSTWTAVLVRVDGTGCFVAAGRDLEVEPPAPVKGRPL